jgi:hypothetical protein
MNIHADKTQTVNSQAVANNLTSQKNNKPAFQLVDNGPEAIAQRKLRRAINNNLTVPQLKGNQEMVKTNNMPPIQRISLGGKKVQEDVKYPNTNEAEVMTHMAGEWGGGNNTAVTGGHLLSAMVDTWGPAVPNSVNPNLTSAPGVHFESSLPGNNIIKYKHTFRLVKKQQGQARISNPKQSTFWPKNWSTANLKQTLNNSYQNGPADTWASKENMSYWYRWQTLGTNTLFPIEKFARPD